MATTGTRAITRTDRAGTMWSRASWSRTSRCRLGNGRARQPERRGACDALFHLGRRLRLEGRRHVGHAAQRVPPARRSRRATCARRTCRAVRRADHHHRPQLHRSDHTRRRCRSSRTRWAMRTCARNRAQHRTGRGADAAVVAAGAGAVVRLLRIKVDDVVSSLSAQQIVNLCFDGNTATCAPSTCRTPAGARTSSTSRHSTSPRSRRAASISRRATSGSSRWAEREPDAAWAGHARDRVHHRLRAHHGGQARQAVDSAGANNGATPSWKWLAIQTFENENFSLLLQERWFQRRVYGNQYVVCAPGSCPHRPTTIRRSTSTDEGAFYFDIGATVNVTKQVSMFVKVDNLFDHDPEPSPQTNTGLDVNRRCNDTLGRFFRIGGAGGSDASAAGPAIRASCASWPASAATSAASHTDQAGQHVPLRVPRIALRPRNASAPCPRASAAPNSMSSYAR